MTRLAGRVLAEPLLHFVAIAGALFALHGVVHRATPAPDAPVTLTPARLADLREKFTLQWKRPPSEAELDGLAKDDLREELLYREALRLGLDRDDVVVRRRLAQKMEFLAGELADASPPRDDELDAYLQAHAAQYREPERVSFTQVFVSSDRHGADAEDQARALLVRLGADDRASGRSAELGDPSLLDPAYERLSEAEVGRIFGDDFARTLFALAPGEWHGPLRSAYGLHLVRLGARTPARTPRLAEVRPRVEADWRRARRDASDAVLLSRLQERYAVVPAGSEARR